jgi:hypothetical protein
VPSSNRPDVSPNRIDTSQKIRLTNTTKTMIFAATVLMVRPASFGYNTQTATNNFFQNQPSLTRVEIEKQVRQEFDNAVQQLTKAGIEVVVFNDTPEPPKPDAVFPNNWFCTMPEKSIQVFPLYAKNRRMERRLDIVKELVTLTDSKTIDDWSVYETNETYLEGTGSMVFDHEYKIAYAVVSERTDKELFKKFCRASGYTPFLFHASDELEQPIYHTNVIMCIGNGFVILCEGAVEDTEEKEVLIHKLQQTGHEVIPITHQQAKSFAGNMLQLTDNENNPVLVMSASAANSLDTATKKRIGKHTHCLEIAVPTIEMIGGGGIRCMMAELF